MDVKLPNGEIIRDVPDGLSREEVIRRYVMKKEPTSEMPSPQVENLEPKPTEKSPSFVEGLPKELFEKPRPTAQMAIGAAKPFAGIAQMASINAPANFLNELSTRFEKESGSPIASQALDFGGQMVNPLPMKGANAAQNVVNKVAPRLAESSLAKGAIQGSTMAAMNPITTQENQGYGDYLERKLQDIGVSALGGAAINKTSQAIMNPKVSEKLKILKDMGVKNFTPGQLLSDVPLVGKALQGLEAKSTSIPIVGDIVRNQLERSNASFNKAMGNKVLAPMGEKIPEKVQAGVPMIDYINRRIEDAYDKITPQLGFKNIIYPSQKTSTIKQFMDFAKDRAKDLPVAEQPIFLKEFQQKFIDNLDSKLAMSGESFRNAEKKLGSIAHSYMKKPEGYDIGIALRDLQAEIRNELAFQNPQLAKQLRGIHDAFINHLPLERAASKLGAKERVFSPNQFESAIKTESKGKGQFASGKSNFYPESQAALEVLGPKVPDSGTAGRLATMGALATSPWHYPATLAPALATAGIYNPIASKILTGVTSGARPQAIQQAQPAVSGALSKAVGTNDYSK